MWNLTFEHRSSRAAKAQAMPAKDGLRLNHPGRTEQAWSQPDHPDQQCAITAAKSKTTWCSPQSDVELMTEKHVFGFKPASRLEQANNENSERAQDRKHHRYVDVLL
jgi:hypothetical protein